MTVASAEKNVTSRKFIVLLNLFVSGKSKKWQAEGAETITETDKLAKSPALFRDSQLTSKHQSHLQNHK